MPANEPSFGDESAFVKRWVQLQLFGTSPEIGQARVERAVTSLRPSTAEQASVMMRLIKPRTPLSTPPQSLSTVSSLGSLSERFVLSTHIV